MKLYSLAILLCIQSAGWSQIVLERQVLSCFSLNICEDFCINSVGGQVDYITFSSSENSISAGFEQPDGPLSLSVSYLIQYNACTGLYEMEITNVFGCGENDSIFYFWNGIEGDSIQTTLPSMTNLSVYAEGGCEFHATLDFDNMDIPVLPCGLDFFTYFSPNGDGDNDSWVIGNISQENYRDNEVIIFNRWGNPVWEARNYDNSAVAFNGLSSDGDPLPDGTYFYQAKVAGIDYSGYIELMR